MVHRVKHEEMTLAEAANPRDNASSTVLRALAMLDIVVEEPRGISLTNAARRAGLGKATTLRLLAALIRGGLVVRDASTGHYRPGLKLVRMGERALETYDLASIARPHMRALADAAGHGVAAGVIEGQQVVYVSRIEASTEIRVHHQVGDRRPIHTSSIGKAILAHLPADELEAVLRGYVFERFTEYTIDGKEAFLRDLSKARRKGWALSRNESVLGGSSISAPVFDHSVRVVGAIGISGVSVALRGAELNRLAESLRSACRAASADLGYVDRVEQSPGSTRQTR